MIFARSPAMLRSTISHLLILACYLVAMGAMCNPTPPPVDDIIHGVPPPANILCEDGFQGHHGLIGRDTAKNDCYTVLGAMNNNLVRLKKESFRGVRNRETGKALKLHEAVNRSRFLKIDRIFAVDGEARHCVIAATRDGNEHTHEAVLPTAQLDTTVYFYFWERVLDLAMQIIEECFDDARANRAGQEEDLRGVSHGESRIEGNNWTFPYIVSIGYDWESRAGRAFSQDSQRSLQGFRSFSEHSWSDSQSGSLADFQDSQSTLQDSQSDSQGSLPDTQDSRRTLQDSRTNSQASLHEPQAFRSHSQVALPESQASRPLGMLSRTCKRIFNSLFCGSHMPSQTG